MYNQLQQLEVINMSNVSIENEQARLWNSLDDERISRIAGDEANSQSLQQNVSALLSNESRLSTEVVQREEGDLRNINSLTELAKALSDYRIKTDLEINNEKIARDQLGVDLNNAINAYTSLFDHKFFLVYQHINEYNSSYENKLSLFDERIKKYEEMLQDITTDSIQITMDNGEINMGAWTILSQAREWDLEILRTLKGYKEDTDNAINEALEDFQNKLPIEQDIIDKAIEQLSNAPVIKELDEKLTNMDTAIVDLYLKQAEEAKTRADELLLASKNLSDQLEADVKKLNEEIVQVNLDNVDALAREAKIRADQLAEMALDIQNQADEVTEQVKADLQVRLDQLDTSLTSLNDYVTALDGDVTKVSEELNNKVTEINASIASETANRIEEISQLRNGVTSEINELKESDLQMITALDNYKVSNDSALANVQDKVIVLTSDTEALATKTEALDVRLTTNETETESAKNIAADSLSKATTALDQNSATASRLTAIEASIEDINTDLDSQVTTTAFNELKTQVSNIEGVTYSNTHDITSLRSDMTDVELGLSGTVTAINELKTTQTAQEGKISQLVSDTTDLGTRIDTVQGDLATKADGTAFNNLSTKVEQQGTTISSISTDVTRLTNDLNTVSGDVAKKADASALNALNNTVVSQGDLLTSQGTEITNLKNSVSSINTDLDAKADQTAVDSLQNTVTAQGGTLTTQGNRITGLEGSVVVLAGEVDKKADNSAVNALDTRIKANETSISNQATAITKLDASLSNYMAGFGTKSRWRATSFNKSYTNSATVPTLAELAPLVIKSTTEIGDSDSIGLTQFGTNTVTHLRGYFFTPTAFTWSPTFYVDDSLRVYINGIQLVEKLGSGSTGAISYNFEANVNYYIDIIVYNHGGGASIAFGSGKRLSATAGQLYATTSDSTQTAAAASAVSNLNTLTTQQGNLITSQSDQIVSLNNTISNIGVGGTNLWANSDINKGFYVDGNGNNISANEVHCVRKTVIEIPTNRTSMVYQVWNPNRVSGGNYQNRVAFYTQDMTFISVATLPTLSGPAYQTLLISIPANARFVKLGAILGSSSTNKIDPTIKVKYEFGNKATDWSPAPEDVDAKITVNATAISSLTNTVTKQGSDLTSQSNQLVNLQNNIDVSLLALNADNINTFYQNNAPVVYGIKRNLMDGNSAGRAAVWYTDASNKTTSVDYGVKAPDGTTGARKFTATANTMVRVGNITGGTANKVYVISCWVRAVTGSLTVTLDYTDNADVKEEVLTTEWKRIYHTGSSNSVMRFMDINLKKDDSIYVYGAQIEEGVLPTAYQEVVSPTNYSGSGLPVGSIWYKTNDNNKAYRYDGTNWVEVTDARVAANASAITNLNSSVTTLGNTVTSQGSQITSLRNDLTSSTADLQGKITANSNSIQTLQNTVTQQGDTLVNQSSQITSLNNAVNTLNNTVANKADTSALNALTSRVATTEGDLRATNESLTSLKSSMGSLSLPLEYDTAQVNKFALITLRKTQPYVSTSVIPDYSYLAKYSATSAEYVAENNMLMSNTKYDNTIMYYRAMFGVTAATTINLGNLVGDDSHSVYVDGVLVFSAATYAAGGRPVSFNVTAGIHTIDLIANNAAGGAGFKLGNLLSTQVSWLYAGRLDSVIQNATNSALSSLNTELTNVKGTVDSNSNQIVSLNNSVSSLNATVSNKADSSAVTGLNSRVTSNEDSITSLTNQTTNLNAELSSVGSQLGNTQTYTIRTQNGISNTGKSNGIFNSKNVSISGMGRGLNLFTVGSNNTINLVGRYDTYGNMATACAALNTALTALADNTYFILVGCDNVGNFYSNSNADAVAVRAILTASGVTNFTLSRMNGTCAIIIARKNASNTTPIETLVLNSWLELPVSITNGTPHGFAENLSAVRNTLATASAVTDLTATVTDQGGAITSLSAQTTSLQNSLNSLTNEVNNKASTSAVNTLNSKVESLEGTVSTQSSQITVLNGAMNNAANNLGSQNKWRLNVYKTPGANILRSFEELALLTPDRSLEYTDADSNNFFASFGDYVTLHFRAYIQVPAALTWNTTAAIDDKLRVYLDGALVHENLAVSSKAISVAIPAGNHFVDILFYNHTGGSYVNFAAGGRLSNQALTMFAANASESLSSVNSKAVSGLKVTTDQQGNKITSQGNDITSLRNDLNTTNNNVSTKADASAVNNLTNRVAAAEGSLSSQSSQIVGLENRLSSLSVGGTNLLAVSNLTAGFVDANTGGDGVNTSHVRFKQAEALGERKTIVYSAAQPDGIIFKVYGFVGDTYTVKGVTLTRNVAYTFPANITKFKIEISGLSGNPKNIETKKVKLEFGSIPTDWSPAPEDIDQQFLANGSAISALDSKVTQQGNSITSQGSQITSLQNSVNNLNSTVNNKADSSALATLTSQVNTIDNKVTAASTDITKLQASLNDMSVGATNLLVNTKDVGNSGTYLGFGYKRSTRPAGSTSFVDSYSAVIPNLSAGTYILSYYARANKTQPVSNFFHLPDNTQSGVSSTGQTSNAGDGGISLTIGTEWKRYWVKWVIPGDVSSKRIVVARLNEVDSLERWVDIAALKLEKGSLPTDWSPAPSDISIDTTQFASANALNVLDAKVTNVDGKVNATSTSLTQLESKVAVNSATLQTQGTVVDGLSASYVVKTDVNGLITSYGVYNSNGVGAFGVNADYFYVGKGTTATNGKKPFMVLTSSQTINGVTYPAGTWMDVAMIANATIGSAHIANASITTAKIQDAAITDAKIYNLNAGKINAGTLDAARIGARTITAEKLTVEAIDAISIEAREWTVVAPNGTIVKQQGSLYEVRNSSNNLLVRMGEW